MPQGSRGTGFSDHIALASTGPGVYRGHVSGEWRIIRGANGGHLAAMLLGGMGQEVDDPSRTPRSFTTHFMRVPKDDTDVEIAVDVMRSGRTMSNVVGRLTQDDKIIVGGMAIFSTDREGPDFAEISMPEVPPPDTIEPVLDRDDFPFGRKFDFRRALGPPPEQRSDRAEVGVWMRLREPTPFDHLVATQLLDAFAPAVFVKLGQGGGGAGVPTIEMTYHYREPLPLARAAPDAWYLGVFRTHTSRGGFIEEDGWLWSQTGTLVAQSRQLALLGS